VFKLILRPFNNVKTNSQIDTLMIFTKDSKEGQDWHTSNSWKDSNAGPKMKTLKEKGVRGMFFNS